MPVQTTETAIDLVSGNYSVTILDANGCEIVDSVFVDQMTGLNEFSEIVNLNIYPNPSNIQFNVELDLNSTMNVRLQLTNSVGQNVSEILKESSNSIRHIFNVEEYPSGVYFLSITSDDRKIVRKIIIEKEKVK